MHNGKIIFVADSGGSKTRAALLRQDGTALAVTVKAGVAAAPGTLPVARIVQETAQSLLEKCERRLVCKNGKFWRKIGF